MFQSLLDQAIQWMLHGKPLFIDDCFNIFQRCLIAFIFLFVHPIISILFNEWSLLMDFVGIDSNYLHIAKSCIYGATIISSLLFLAAVLKENSRLALPTLIWCLICFLIEVTWMGIFWKHTFPAMLHLWFSACQLYTAGIVVTFIQFVNWKKQLKLEAEQSESGEEELRQIVIEGLKNCEEGLRQIVFPRFKETRFSS